MPTYKVIYNKHRPTTEEMDADDLDDLRGWIHELGMDWEHDIVHVEEIEQDDTSSE